MSQYGNGANPQDHVYTKNRNPLSLAFIKHHLVEGEKDGMGGEYGLENETVLSHIRWCDHHFTLWTHSCMN
jgi:hypothetical protein